MSLEASDESPRVFRGTLWPAKQPHNMTPKGKQFTVSGLSLLFDTILSLSFFIHFLKSECYFLIIHSRVVNSGVGKGIYISQKSSHTTSVSFLQPTSTSSNLLILQSTIPYIL